MTVWVECPNCGGKVEIPDKAPSDFTCPMCKYALPTSRSLERTRRLPSDSAPSWMRPWGYTFTIIGGLAFAVGVIREYSASSNPPMVAVIVAGLLNPIFFIGLPLGIYWLRRSKKSQPLAAIDSGKPDSTVPCEKLEQPCTVNRTDDAMHWYHTKDGLWTICLCIIITGIIAGIYLGSPSLGPDVNKSDKADRGTQQSATGSSSHATSAQVGSPGADSGLRTFETVRESYDRVSGLIFAERYAEAMDACNKEIAVSPDDPWFYYLRAYIHYSRVYIRRSAKDYSLCLRDLDSAISKIEARPPSNELNGFRVVCEGLLRELSLAESRGSGLGGRE